MGSIQNQNVRDPNCVFCKIISRQIPSTIVSEDNLFISIRDLSPQAPTHILVIPKDHIVNITEADSAETLGSLFMEAARLSRAEGLHNGFRLIVNTGDHGGQTVPHLHIHLVGGRPLTWPPG